MNEPLLWAAIVAVAVIFRFNLGRTEACKVVGLEISDVKQGTGFQDAVTPPWSAYIAIGTWIAIVSLVGVMFWSFGAVKGGLAVAVIVVVSILAGLLVVPKPMSRFWVSRIYHSMVKREAAYRKNNDHMRADAVRGLRLRIEERLGAVLRDGGVRGTSLASGNATLASTEEEKHSTIAADFGAFIEAHPLIGVRFYDASLLPHPKEEIVRSLLHVYKIAPNKRTKDAAGASLVMLSGIQPDIGPVSLGDLPENFEAMSITMSKGKVSVLESAQAVAAADTPEARARLEVLRKRQDEESRLYRDMLARADGNAAE